MPNENLRIIDLHTHSTESDGVLAPGELVRAAVAQGIGVLGLTDHDTTSGCAEAAAAASAYGIEFVAGIEVSSYYGDREYHLLGYFINLRNGALVDYEQRMHVHRRRRLDLILTRLRETGVEVSLERKAAGVLTRSHVARALVDAGHAEDFRQAFDMFLTPGAPGHVPAATIDMKSAIRLIHGAGGVTSLAHPGDWTPEDDLLELVRYGLDAIEVIHPSHDERLQEYYEAMADRLGILKTGGSDFHGTHEDGRTSLGQYNLQESWYLDLRNRRIGT